MMLCIFSPRIRPASSSEPVAAFSEPSSVAAVRCLSGQAADVNWNTAGAVMPARQGDVAGDQQTLSPCGMSGWP